MKGTNGKKKLCELSIIVPAYNAEKTIGECVSALLSQDYPPDMYEVIFVDDGSTDNTAGIVKSTGAHYVYQENRGPAAARNLGAGMARGEIILFTDADCVPKRDWLRMMVVPFKDRQVIAVKGAYRNGQRSLTSRFVQLEFEERYKMLKKSPSIDMVDTHAAAFRKSVFIKEGGFDSSFPHANNEDTELSYRLNRKGYKMVFNPDAIVYHLGHPDTIKKYCRLKFWRGYWRIMVYKKFPEKAVRDTYTPQTLKLTVLLFYLLPLFILIGIMIPSAKFYVLTSWMTVYLISLLPFLVFSVRTDTIVGLVSPLYLSLRAVAIGTGVLWAVASSWKADGRTIINNERC